MREYAIYLRKSRKDRELEKSGAGDTLQRHRNTLLSFAKKNNYVISHIYEEVVSGDSIAARPQMQMLLADVEEGKYAGVLVMEVERLARGDTQDQGIVSNTFLYSGTLIITPVKIYNPSDQYDQEYFEFGLFMSRREYNTIKRRLHSGMAAAAREGKFIHNVAPFGYRRIKAPGKGYTLEIVPEEAEVVRMVFTWYTKGYTDENGQLIRIGTSLIARKLNTEYPDIKTRSGKPWTVATLSDMLRNEHYIGKIVWGKRKRGKKMSNGNIITSDARRKDYELFDGLHDAIIDDETFGRAAAILSKNRPVINNGITNPLAGVVKCGVCGRSMYRRPYVKKGQLPSLICQEPTCSNVSCRFDLVETAILDALSEWVSNYSIMPESDCADNTLEGKRLLLDSSMTRTEEIKAKLTRVYDAFENGIYDTDTFVSRQKAVNEELKQNSDTILRLQEEIERQEQLMHEQVNIIPKAKLLLDVYGSSDDVVYKNTLMKEVVEKVVYIKTANGHFKDQRQDDFQISIFPRLPKS